MGIFSPFVLNAQNSFACHNSSSITKKAPVSNKLCARDQTSPAASGCLTVFSVFAVSDSVIYKNSRQSCHSGKISFSAPRLSHRCPTEICIPTVHAENAQTLLNGNAPELCSADFPYFYSFQRTPTAVFVKALPSARESSNSASGSVKPKIQTWQNRHASSIILRENTEEAKRSQRICSRSPNGTLRKFLINKTSRNHRREKMHLFPKPVLLYWFFLSLYRRKLKKQPSNYEKSVKFFTSSPNVLYYTLVA